METLICLCTINATYQHCAFGLRYLFANLKRWQPHTRLLEFTAESNARDIAESILAEGPRVVGFGVYIWNARQTLEVVSLLKRVRPELVVVLGGPEVSHETSSQKLCELADVTIQGEGDLLFHDLCDTFLTEGTLPSAKWIAAPLPDIRQIASPYPYYSDEDLRNRVLYVEASRGCPYRCEFCLSSLDKSVRGFDLDRFTADLDALIARGARQFKFVDRTFNLSIASSTRLLTFFLERAPLGIFLHFEMVPDRLPEELRALIRRFPAGSLQFEIGIQTWSPEVAKNVSRRQDYAKVRENFRFLREETSTHLHADLIVGLPGETLESFARGFDAVAALEPHEIQVGLLKRLKGTPISRHDQTFSMVYQEEPPFQILSTRDLDFATIQRLGRFSRFWDLYANRGQFPKFLDLLKELARTRPEPSLFAEFLELTEFLSVRHAQRHGIALVRLVESAWLYLTEKREVDPERARAALLSDYCGTVSRDVPVFLRTEALPARPGRPVKKARRATPARQVLHLAGRQAPPATPPLDS